MPMSQVAIKEQREKPPRRSGGAAQPRKRAPKAPARSPRSNGAPPKVGPASQNKARGGRRLASAFEVVSGLPALAEARRRVTLACEREGSSPTELAEAIESDVALVIAVMSAANNVGSPRGGTGVVREAIERLGRRGVEEAVAEVDTYDPFESPTVAVERYERFRRHAVATRCAADRIAEAARLGDRDELAVAALLHDVGHLVLTELYGDFDGLDRQRLVPLLYEFPHSGEVRRRTSDPCPLSTREIDALRGLAEGKVYKQIAHELSLSVSTIRTHLHNVYRKIGAVDRAQAVLMARDHGWI